MSDFKTPIDIDFKSVVGFEQVAVKKETTSTVDHIRAFANIPARYKNAKFVPGTPIQEKIVKKLRDNFAGKRLQDVSDVLLFGSLGVGKTHIVCGLLNSLIDSEVYCRFSTEHELLELYFRKEYKQFDGFKKVKLLVIDEIGKRQLQDWQLIQLEELLSYRYNEMLPTILITNLKTDEFKQFVGERITRRLKDNSVVQIAVNGEEVTASDFIGGAK